MPPRRHPWRRLAAWAVDWGVILAYCAVVLVPVGLAISASGIAFEPWAGNLFGFVVLILPATLWLAASEARRGTPGKRLLGLAVIDRDTDAAPSFRNALLRNVLKIMLPWELGHTLVFGLAFDTDASTAPDAWLLVIGALAYAIPIAYIVSLFIGRGRAPYDLLSRTLVTVVR